MIVMFSLERHVAIINQLEAVKKFINWIFTYSIAIASFTTCFFLLWLSENGNMVMNIIIASIISYALTLIVIKMPKIIKIYKNSYSILMISPLLALLLIIYIVL